MKRYRIRRYITDVGRPEFIVQQRVLWFFWKDYNATPLKTIEEARECIRWREQRPPTDYFGKIVE
jgi:hypothetical protein